jgi:predicted kinase
MADHAGRIVQAGHSTIVDAVCGRPEDRRAFEEVAMRSSVGFVGLWLDAPQRALVERVLRRQADASDADEAVVRQQLAQDVGEISWSRIDASSSPAVVLAAAISRLQEKTATAG